MGSEMCIRDSYYTNPKSLTTFGLDLASRRSIAAMELRRRGTAARRSKGSSVPEELSSDWSAFEETPVPLERPVADDVCPRVAEEPPATLSRAQWRSAFKDAPAPLALPVADDDCPRVADEPAGTLLSPPPRRTAFEHPLPLQTHRREICLCPLPKNYIHSNCAEHPAINEGGK